MTKLQKFFLCVIIVFTLTSRFVALNKVPPSLSNDEISIAYDAYSVLHTGRDEHNQFLPVSFQSHNTYKAPLYAYLATVTNFLFGNSDVSVRLPSAILGSLTVFILGYLVYLLTSNLNLSLLASGVLAFSPWHIYASRMALESNIAVFFVTLGLLFWFLSFKKGKSWTMLLSFISFALSIWGYHTEWGLTPMIIVGLILFFYKKIPHRKYLVIGLLLFSTISFPIYSNAWLNRGTNARANTEIITKDPGVDKVFKNPQSSSFAKVSVLGRTFLTNYSEYTNPGYFFIDGFLVTRLLPKNDPYAVGLFLASFYPFFFWGLFKLRHYFKDSSKFIYFWLLVSPLVPSLTIGEINFVRNLSMAIPVALVVAVGLYDLRHFLTKKFWGSIFVVCTLVSLCYFLVIYYYHFPREMAENYQYGYEQAALYIKQNYSQYDSIIVDPRFGSVNIYVGVPHLYLSYFTKINPRELSENRDKPGILMFYKYQIRDINWNSEIIKPKTLYLVPRDNQPTVKETLSKLQIVNEIKLPDQTLEFVLWRSL